MAWTIRNLFGGGNATATPSQRQVPHINGKPVGQPSRGAPIHSESEQRDYTAWLVREVERDPQFKLGYLTVAALVQYANVSIEVDSPDPRAKALADDLQEHWYACIPDMTRAFAYGRQALEFWYRPRLSKDGLRLIAGIEPLPFADTERSKEPGCAVRVGRGDSAKDLPADCSAFITVDASAEFPDGRSRYRGAAEAVMRKRADLEKQYGVYMRKFANGVFIGKAPSSYPESPLTGRGEAGQVDPATGQPLNPQQDLATSISAVESGGSIIVDSATDATTNAPLFEVGMQTIQPQSGALENRERALNDAALMSLGVPPRAVAQDAATGSYAMSETHRKILNATVEGLLTQFTTQYQETICREVSLVNFGRDLEFRATWQPLEEDRSATILELVKTVLTSPAASPLILEGVVDFAKLLEVAAIPAGPDVLAALARAKAAMPMGMPSMPGASPLLVGEPGPAVAAGADSVAATALNGAQITSMVEVVSQVAAGQLPLASALPILQAAFPMLPADVLGRIVKPLATFEPTSAQPIAMSQTQKPDGGRNWQEHAAELAKRILARREELAASLGQDRDWGRL